MIGGLVDNPDESRVGPSDSKVLQIDEIIRLDNPEVTTPQVGSSGGVSTQLKIVITSGESKCTKPPPRIDKHL
jgi:hypothetical protein